MDRMLNLTGSEASALTDYVKVHIDQFTPETEDEEKAFKLLYSVYEKLSQFWEFTDVDDASDYKRAFGS